MKTILKGEQPMNALRGCSIAVALLLCCLSCAAAPAPPNVVLIISDDQGYGDLSLHGNPQVRTPHLDRLATNGIRFDRFFVSPVCAPTRASLLTGRYSLRTGARGVTRGEETMRGEEVTVAEALRAAGYRNGYFGKWHNGEHFPYTPSGQGFEDIFGFNLGHWNNYFDTTLERNTKLEKTRGYVSDVLTDAALGFMESNRARPFFCYVAYNVPHSPFQVPERYFARHKAAGLNDYLATVYGMVENMDDNIGRVLAKLEELKLRENTIVIFLSDNGPNGARYNAGMRGVKNTFHEGGTRVPFFLSWPARYPQPRTVREIAAHIDVFPTLLELCGVPMPKTLPQDGRSLVTLLDGRTNGWPDRILFNQWLPGPRAEQSGALRTQRFRLVKNGSDWQVFDMQRDPEEKRDASADFLEEKKRLVAAYEQWWQEIKADMPSPWPPPIPVGHAEENPVELPVPQSRFSGGLRFSGKHPNNAWLTNWTDTAARVEWKLDVVRGGTYAVTLSYLCREADAGARIRVKAGASTTEVLTQATPMRLVPSPDRVPREEVYEMEWHELPAGRLTLPQGAVTLSIEALTKPGVEVMQLKSLFLGRRTE
jgi:arylsulfatase A-like enzyme